MGLYFFLILKELGVSYRILRIGNPYSTKYNEWHIYIYIHIRIDAYRDWDCRFLRSSVGSSTSLRILTWKVRVEAIVSASRCEQSWTSMRGSKWSLNLQCPNLMLQKLRDSHRNVKISCICLWRVLILQRLAEWDWTESLKLFNFQAFF